MQLFSNHEKFRINELRFLLLKLVVSEAEPSLIPKLL